MIPKNITKENLLKAIDEISNLGKKRSAFFNLVLFTRMKNIHPN